MIKHLGCDFSGEVGAGMDEWKSDRERFALRNGLDRRAGVNGEARRILVSSVNLARLVACR